MGEEQAKHRLLSRDEVEQTYGISKRFLEACAGRGDGPAMVRLGRLVRYRQADIEAWIERQVDDPEREMIR